MSQGQPQRPAGDHQDPIKYGDVFDVSGQLASKPIAPRDAVTMVLGQTQRGGPAAVMQSAANINERAGLVGHYDVTNVARDDGVTVSETVVDGQRIVEESVGGQLKKPVSPITPTADHHRPIRPFSTAATFITSYNSLYENNNPANDGGDPDAPVAVDFITAFTSHRFFFSSPGQSNSIVESSTPTTAFDSTTTSISSSSNAASNGETLLNNSLAIPSTYSADPYADFRQSMEEMVEAHGEIDVAKSSWEFLHELLLCYLALNPKSTHKHVLKAFADIAMAIKPTSPPLPQIKATEEGGSGGRRVESTAGGNYWPTE